MAETPLDPSPAAARQADAAPPPGDRVGDFPLLVESKPPGLVGRYFVTQRHVLGLVFGGVRAWVRAQQPPQPRLFGFARLVSALASPFLDRELRDLAFPVQLRRRLEILGPTYIKLGQVLSLREDLLPAEITDELKLLLDKLRQYPEITAVGGLTIGADPLASAVSALSFETGQNLKAFLVRKEAKGHGTGSLIEGDLDKGEKVAILEDTVTTGGSAKKAIDAVLAVGATPVVVMAIADREDADADAFRKEWKVDCLLKLSEIKKG